MMIRSVNLALMEAASRQRQLEAKSDRPALHVGETYAETWEDRRLDAPAAATESCFVISLTGQDG